MIQGRSSRTEASPNPAFADALVALLPRLRRYARVLAGDRAAADDLVQDTLERAWARQHQWRVGTDLRAWLFSIMHNRRIDLARSERPTVDTDILDDVALPVAGAAGLGFEPLDLQRAFDRLADEHREVLLLVAVEQLSYEEAADAAGVPVGTVMSRLSRARAKLRAGLTGGAPSALEAPATARLKRVK